MHTISSISTQKYNFFGINKYFFLNEMQFIYLFYIITADCQLTKEHIPTIFLWPCSFGDDGPDWEFGRKEERENIKDLYDYVTLVENYPRTD